MTLITALISAGGLVLGSIIGGICSWLVTRRSSERTIAQQMKMQRENFRYQELHREKECRINANLVRLDIANSLYQSIRVLQSKEELSYLYAIPINRDYHKSISSLSDKYTLLQLSYLYQLYGIIDKVNSDISLWHYGDESKDECIRKGFLDIVKKVYGDNYSKVLEKDINSINYTDLYKDELMKEGYRVVLERLDFLCLLENLEKETPKYN